MNIFKCLFEKRVSNRQIYNLLYNIGTRIMATEAELVSDVQTLTDLVTALNPKLDTVAALVTDLKAQVAAGQVVSQETLDALDASVKEAQSTLVAETAKVDAVTAP